MKNKEKFAKEIFDIACRGDSIAITIANNEIVPCESIECDKCIFKVKEYEECSDKIKNGVNRNMLKNLLLHQEKRTSFMPFYLILNILQEIIAMNFIYTMKNQHERIAIGI